MKGFENRQHLIGEGTNPILILKKGEVPDLFNDLFYYIYSLWYSFHYGKELIDWKSLDLGYDIIDCVIAMEAHFDRHFSNMQVLIKYTEASLRRPRL